MAIRYNDNTLADFKDFHRVSVCVWENEIRMYMPCCEREREREREMLY